MGVVLPVALAFAEVVGVALLLALPVAVTVALAVPFAGPPVALPPDSEGGRLDALGAGITLGVADVLALAGAAGVEVVGHAAGEGLVSLSDVLPWAALPDEPSGNAEPFRLGGPWLALLVLKPTAEPIWSNASCSGGTARAMPMANTAQAIATAGRSSLSRQSRAGRRG